MTKNTPMLITKISEYIDDPKHLKALYKAYHTFELRKHYDFQDDKLNNFTIQRGLILIRHLFFLQIILNKTMYMPGIWLFSVFPRKYDEIYTFPETLQQMSTQGRSAWFTEKIIHNDMIKKIIIDDKINFEKLDILTFQIKALNSDKFNFIQSIETKTSYLNELIKEFLGLPELKVIHSEEYKGWKKFEDIVEDYKLNQEFSLQYFLEWLDTNEVWFNMRIVEDLIILIGYIENNKEKFVLK